MITRGFILLTAALPGYSMAGFRAVAKRERKPIGINRRRVASTWQQPESLQNLGKTERPQDRTHATSQKVGEAGRPWHPSHAKLGSSWLQPQLGARGTRSGSILQQPHWRLSRVGPISKLDTSQNNSEKPDLKEPLLHPSTWFFPLSEPNCVDNNSLPCRVVVAHFASSFFWMI
jgi:hypothetical protein